jgi:topoisomerase-4 subunit A
MSYIKKIFDLIFWNMHPMSSRTGQFPILADGLKPVQRRILHSLFEMDDGKFHKVANVVGHCMKYHPHGDASIYSALVVLANKELFIDKQGNFGNIFTGDEASAARYIECRLLPLAKEVFLNPDITEYEDSYDGRNREPVAYPAKLPVVLLLGAEGIAVGMSTKILPHNFNEVLDAVSESIAGRQKMLYPDFPSGGIMDVSGYDDGNGKVLVRAKLDTKDPKKIVIRELP